MDHDQLHARARDKGVNPVVYCVMRALLQPLFHVYFRMARIGREHVPKDGPLILASNHRSFVDPFVIGMCMRRPIYYVAKKELFENRLLGWLLNALGAFPVDRGAADEEMLKTAKAILARGDAIVMFPEGTRIRPGSLGSPKRGVGRLALESGAPVVPVAVIGTEAVRRGWRVRPHKVRVRVGRPLTFPRVESASPQLAAAVTDRIWPCVMLQWEWLGGLAPLRRAAVIGAGERGAAVASLLSRGGLSVDMGEPDTSHDLVCFAVPAAELPAAVAAHGAAVPQRAGALVLADELVPPLGTLPSAYVAERVHARAVATLGDTAGASVVVGAPNRAFARQLTDVLSAAGMQPTATRDLAGVELAACAVDAIESPARARVA